MSVASIPECCCRANFVRLSVGSPVGIKVTCSKTGKPVREVLLSKHPSSSQPPEEVLLVYDALPSFIDLDVTAAMVEKVATWMQGAAGPGRVNSIVWQDWLLQYGYASFKVQDAVANLTRGLSNSRPPWAAYQAIVAGRLIALDKCPSMHLVGLGEILLRLIGKCVIAVCGKDVTDACSTHQLCGDLKAGIKRAIHWVNSMWEEHGEESNWGHPSG
eukprot:11173696-Ditylum_brightwellii.AAC.1